MANAHRSEPGQPVHASAAVGYAQGAHVYETGRPGYPPEVLDWLRDIVGLTAGRTAVEVGAGDGAFTRRLMETGTRICAIEPVAAMRDGLKRRVPGALIAAGTADALPLRDATAGAIICAQSFHWFASAATLAEFARVLIPGGTLALLWNMRDESIPWVRRLSALTDEYEGRTPRYKTGEWEHAFEGSGFVQVDRREVAHAHSGPPAQVVIARTLSVSFVAAMTAERRQALTARLERLIEEEPALAGHSTVAFPYRTVMLAYRRPAAAR